MAVGIDGAVIGRLRADPVLATLAPGGVWRDLAPGQTAEPYVIVSLAASEDVYVCGGTAWVSQLYIVKAVHRHPSAGPAGAAADRVHDLLQDATLVWPGYRALLIQREERITYVETDERTEARYQHVGGLYRLLAEPVS